MLKNSTQDDSESQFFGNSVNNFFSSSYNSRDMLVLPACLFFYNNKFIINPNPFSKNHHHEKNHYTNARNIFYHCILE